MTAENAESKMTYLDLQAYAGVTKHMGGFEATNELLQRAKQEGVEDRVEFRTTDVLDLPFEVDRFDVVLCESVLAFIEDKPRAIRECVRVVKPGGYVGLNETFWIEEMHVYSRAWEPALLQNRDLPSTAKIRRSHGKVRRLRRGQRRAFHRGIKSVL
ncbi:MAG: class I SAM-dependent methyltransferase, partial [Promethearchaeota archaeon]